MRHQKFGDVLALRVTVVIGCGQCRRRMSDPLSILFGFYCELGHSGARDRCDARDVGALIEQHQLFKPDVADFAIVAKYEFGCG